MITLKKVSLIIVLCCLCGVGFISQSKAKNSGWLDSSIKVSISCTGTVSGCNESLRTDYPKPLKGGHLYEYLYDQDRNYSPTGLLDVVDNNEYSLFNERLFYDGPPRYIYEGVNGTDALVVTERSESSHISQYTIYPVTDIKRMLTKYIDTEGNISYRVDSTQMQSFRFTGAYDNSTTISRDKRYLFVLYYPNTNLEARLLKMNITTGEKLNIHLDNVNTSRLSRVNAVSSDGRYALTPDAIYDTESCYTASEGNKCKNINYSQILEDSHPGESTDLNYLRASFYDNDKKILVTGVRYIKPDLTPEIHSYTLSIGAMFNLKYLALGDSYSSGEGSGGNYRAGTDEDGSRYKPTEKCHISTTSYPYLLAGRMGYLGSGDVDPASEWNSIACSGAVIKDINSSDSASYLGQAGDSRVPRLKNFDVDTLKKEAMDNMIPGRQKQIEFIKKYQPKAITISIGGNDVQFAKVIKACAAPWLSGGEYTYTCSYATSDSKKSLVAYTIASQQNYLISLYEELLAAGPSGMKLYVIGYPDFVDQDNADSSCGKLVGLTVEERRMINESNGYLNQVTRYAADAAGAIYISMRTSLGNHVLCGDARNNAVNGLMPQSPSESFHPNPLGHKLMADRIESVLGEKDFIDFKCHDTNYVTCPGGTLTPVTIPLYFKGAMRNNSHAISAPNLTEKDTIQVKKRTIISVLSGVLKRATAIKIKIFSDERDLGTYSTDNDGAFIGNISLPEDMPSGYHTLVLEGTNVNGEAVRLWKIVFVENPNDKRNPSPKEAIPPNKPNQKANQDQINSLNSTDNKIRKTTSQLNNSGRSDRLNDASTLITDKVVKKRKNSYVIAVIILFAILTLCLVHTQRKIHSYQKIKGGNG